MKNLNSEVSGDKWNRSELGQTCKAKVYQKIQFVIFNEVWCKDEISLDEWFFNYIKFLVSAMENLKFNNFQDINQNVQKTSRLHIIVQ